MWDLPYVKLKVWDLVWPRIKPGQDRKVHHKEFFFGGLKFTGLLELVREKKSKLILWDCVGQIPGKISRFCRMFKANFT